MEGGEKWGRYSFLGFDPRIDVVLRDGLIQVQNGETYTEHTENPGTILREILSQYKPPHMDGLPPFTGGFVGYFSYDSIKYFEEIA